MNTDHQAGADPRGDVPRDRALQPIVRRLPVPSARALARRALPIAVGVATTAMATLAFERALARAATRILPASAPVVALPRRRIVITEHIQIERFRVRH